METVVDGHLDVGPVCAHADRAGGDDGAVFHHRRRERRQAVLGARLFELGVERTRLGAGERRQRQEGARADQDFQEHGATRGQGGHGVSSVKVFALAVRGERPAKAGKALTITMQPITTAWQRCRPC